MQARAIVRKLADPIKHQVHNLLADGLMATGEVVRGVFLP